MTARELKPLPPTCACCGVVAPGKFICDRCVVGCGRSAAAMAVLRLCANRGVTLVQVARWAGLVPTDKAAP